MQLTCECVKYKYHSPKNILVNFRSQIWSGNICESGQNSSLVSDIWKYIVASRGSYFGKNPFGCACQSAHDGYSALCIQFNVHCN